MPLRQDPSLWFNLPGVVAAYQPVRAPDSLLARYNMRQGGTSAYRAEPGVLPAWKSAAGWGFNGSTQYLNTGVVPLVGCSFFARYSNATQTGYRVLIGAYGPALVYHSVFSYYGGDKILYSAGNYQIVDGSSSAGVLGVAGQRGYKNGIVNSPEIASPANGDKPLTIGVDNGGGAYYFAGNIGSIAIYNRTLTPAEVWMASRQMAYCDVNPDWSVWSPRRKWFPYVLAGAGFQAAWAERANRLIGGG